MIKCPGQDQRFWKPEDIFEVPCSHCGNVIEFFKDEPQLKCRKCGRLAVNPRIDLGCAQWCLYAEQCLGAAKIKNINTLRDQLIDELKGVFGDDQKRITHALAVLHYAEQIQEAEGGDPLVIKASAILHDIGIPEAERKHGSSAGHYQEIEGPPLARKILDNHDLDHTIVDDICRIIANHHSAKDIDTLEFRIIWDADWLVNMKEEFPGASKEKLQDKIQKIFKTPKGRQVAEQLFLGA